MLDLIRKKQKSPIVKLIFWTIIAAFVGTIFLVWGKGSDRSGGDPSAAITVNETNISFDKYQRTYSDLYNLYQGIYRDQFTPAMEKQLGLKRQALNTLIDQALLLQEADRLGLEVSKKELITAIAEIPAFQQEGVFNKDLYIQALAYQRLNTEDFEALQEQDLLIGKVRDGLKAGISVADEDIEKEYRDQNEKVDLAFLRLTPALMENRVKVEKEALEAFFAENRESFRQSEKVSLRYLQFDPARYEKDLSFSEEELKKYYRQHLDLYEIEEQAKAAHILIKVTEDADEATRAAKKELAEKVLAEARAGKDFAELARANSDDAGSAVAGGDLGFFGRGTMVAAFENAAFALKPGEISEVVETPFGFHVIKSEAYIEAGIKPIAEVMSEVKEGRRKDKAVQVAFEKAMDAYNINRKDGSIEKAAEANDLGVKETGLFAAGEAINGLGDAPEIASAALALSKGEIARPVSIDKGIFLFAVKERKESRLPELEEVRSEVEQAYRAEKSVELARLKAELLLAQLKEGKKLAELAMKEGIDVEETGPFTRTYGTFIPRIGGSEALAKAAFELTEEAPVADQAFDLDGKFFVATLKERQAADMTGLDETKKEELKTTLLTRKEDEALSKKIDELREKAQISLSVSLQNSLQGE